MTRFSIIFGPRNKPQSWKLLSAASKGNIYPIDCRMSRTAHHPNSSAMLLRCVPSLYTTGLIYRLNLQSGFPRVREDLYALLGCVEHYWPIWWTNQVNMLGSN